MQVEPYLFFDFLFPAFRDGHLSFRRVVDDQRDGLIPDPMPVAQTLTGQFTSAEEEALVVRTKRLNLGATCAFSSVVRRYPAEER
jgi:hypothetical protein